MRKRKAECKVAVRGDEERRVAEGYIIDEVPGVFVHRRMVRKFGADEYSQSSHEWQITHINTGLGVFGSSGFAYPKTLKETMNILARLSKFNWDTDDMREDNDWSEFTKSVREAVTQKDVPYDESEIKKPREKRYFVRKSDGPGYSVIDIVTGHEAAHHMHRGVAARDAVAKNEADQEES